MWAPTVNYHSMLNRLKQSLYFFGGFIELHLDFLCRRKKKKKKCLLSSVIWPVTILICTGTVAGTIYLFYIVIYWSQIVYSFLFLFKIYSPTMIILVVMWRFLFNLWSLNWSQSFLLQRKCECVSMIAYHNIWQWRKSSCNWILFGWSVIFAENTNGSVYVDVTIK